MIRRLVRYADRRSGSAPLLTKALRYVFPDHWTFLLGEIALYCFVVLVGTGIYLTLFFQPSTEHVHYHGSYAPLHGVEMSQAYQSAVDLSFDVKAGLLMRQTHHWAADVFLVAIVLHLMRVFFTGAFRKPRDGVWYVGVMLLGAAILEGFLGYSIVDDLLSGMGLAIAYSVVLSLPIIGGNLALLLWDGPFPGSHVFESRMYATHVLLLPVAIGLLLSLHLLLIVARHHTQFPGPRRSERRIVGSPAFPGYAPRSIGLLFGVASALFLLGGLVQINPIWQWGPFETAQATNGAQPDWYLGWLIGGLRLMPGFDVTIGSYTLVPNPFWGGALFPLVVFAFLFAWPSLERRLTGDYAFHNLLDSPRQNPMRTAVGAAMLTWVFVVFVAGSSDRVFVWLKIPYDAQIWFWRGMAIALPLAVYAFTRRFCEALGGGQDAPAGTRIVEA